VATRENAIAQEIIAIASEPKIVRRVKGLRMMFSLSLLFCFLSKTGRSYVYSDEDKRNINGGFDLLL
jgi:hypothetical protein